MNLVVAQFSLTKQEEGGAGDLQYVRVSVLPQKEFYSTGDSERGSEDPTRDIADAMGAIPREDWNDGEDDDEYEDVEGEEGRREERLSPKSGAQTRG